MVSAIEKDEARNGAESMLAWGGVCLLDEIQK